MCNPVAYKIAAGGLLTQTGFGRKLIKRPVGNVRSALGIEDQQTDERDRAIASTNETISDPSQDTKVKATATPKINRANLNIG